MCTLAGRGTRTQKDNWKERGAQCDMNERGYYI